MELALSLGERPKPFSLVGKSEKMLGKDLGFCMGVGSDGQINDTGKETDDDGETRVVCSPPVQLDLLPISPVPRTPYPSSNKFPFPWLHQKWRRGEEGGDQEGGYSLSSPNSSTAASSFQMDFSIFRSNARSSSGKRESEQINGEDRGSDEEENGTARKKLRLTKDQSAFLEESFKEHNTLNPKQKLALAKQLNLRPRQVEVWFQNRRARTKLKQTEVDCEYLKRWCETLTEENTRLQKELQELRALKASQPFYMQLPPTTLTMCPSCERVVSTTTAAAKTTPSKHLSLSPSQHQAADVTSSH